MLATMCVTHSGQSRSHGSVMAARSSPTIAARRQSRGSIASPGPNLAKAPRTANSGRRPIAATMPAAMSRLKLPPPSSKATSGNQQATPAPSHEPPMTRRPGPQDEEQPVLDDQGQPREEPEDDRDGRRVPEGVGEDRRVEVDRRACPDRIAHPVPDDLVAARDGEEPRLRADDQLDGGERNAAEGERDKQRPRGSGHYSAPASNSARIQGMTSSSIWSSVVVASKPSMSRALRTSGTRRWTSCSNGGSVT